MKEQWMFFGCLLFRFLNSLFIKNSFTPDEHWQSSEVAHYLIFGYGFLTWEWEKCVALRNILHPSLIAGFYFVLKWFGIDTPWLVAYGPRILFGTLTASLVDWGVYKLTRLWLNKNTASLAFLFSVMSWFYLYSLTRTYSGCLEAVFNIWGVYFWSKFRQEKQCHDQNGFPISARQDLTKSKYQGKGQSWGSILISDRNLYSIVYSLILGSLGIALRPTSVLFLLPVYYGSLISDFIFKRINLSDLLVGLFFSPVILGIVPVMNIFLDHKFYKIWTIPSLNFATFNLFANAGKFYGSRPWHFYWLECQLVIFLTYIPFLLFGVYSLLLQVKKSLFIDMAKSQASNNGDSSCDTSLESMTSKRQQSDQLRQRRNQKKSSTKKFMHEDVTKSSEFSDLFENIQKLEDFLIVLIVIFFNIIFLSQTSHKEYRLLLPLSPFFFPLVAVGLQSFQHQKILAKYISCFQKYMLYFLIGTQIVMFLLVQETYLTGAEKSMTHLRNHLKSDNLQRDQTHKTVYFLTPCHQLPFYSFIHDPNVKLGFLDCSPQLRQLDHKMYAPSWRHRFWDSPIETLNTLFPKHLIDQSQWNQSAKDSVDAYVDPTHKEWLFSRKASWFGGIDSDNREDARFMDQLFKKPSLNSMSTCLDYRFGTQLIATSMPDYFVIPSAALIAKNTIGKCEVENWLHERHYELIDSIFDSIISEHPKPDMPMEFFSRILIFKRQ